jgi:O-antigen/teichoic acid export membrane protein
MKEEELEIEILKKYIYHYDVVWPKPEIETSEVSLVPIEKTDPLVRVARNATALFLSDIVSKGALFLWQLILARWLGAAGYGIYGTIGALMVIGASIVEFGMGLIVVREVARRPRDAPRFLAATLTVQPILAVATYGALQLAAWRLDFDSELRALLSLAALALLINALGNICHNQLIAAERMDLPAAISVVHVLSLVGLAAAALWMGGGLWGLYLATLAAGLIRSALYWLALLSTGRASIGSLDRTTVLELFQNGLPLALMSFLTLCSLQVDKVLATTLIGTQTAGYLTAAFVISFGVMELLNTTVLVALLPTMSRFAEESEEVLYRMIGKLTLLTMTLALPIAVLISMLATPLCTWLFGDRFWPTADALRILIWYTSLAMVSNIFSQGLVVQNRQKRLTAFRTAGLVLAVTLNLVLLPRLGVTGAALAALISEAFVFVLMVGSFRLSADWWRPVETRSFRLAVAAFGLAAVTWWLRTRHPLMAGLAGIPVYVGLVYLTGTIGAEEKDLIQRLLSSMLPGRMAFGFNRGQEDK